MDNKNVTMVKCKVCGGKGGWKKQVATNWLENNWQDCLYCDMLGFVEQEQKSKEEVAQLLAYNGYKKIITDTLEDFGKVLSYTTIDKARTITIDFLADDRQQFITFVQYIVKQMHSHTFCTCEMSQVFFYGAEDAKTHYHWRIVLKPNEIIDLDGFVEYLKEWAIVHKRRK